MVKWSSSSGLGAELIVAVSGIGIVEVCGAKWACGTEEVLVLAGLDLLLLVTRGTTAYPSSSETGEGADLAGLFPFFLSIELVCIWTSDFFCALTSSRSLLITPWSSIHRIPSRVLLTSKLKLFFIAVSSRWPTENWNWWIFSLIPLIAVA